ncbi:MAG: NUDIX hydrolase [Candidatus Levybacteria bacterium]|nr:NUDIX hydrolase [Candidatus Levybacteria bacterium]
MHKTFYASGFLYLPQTQQILLQQGMNQTSPQWELIGGMSKKGESAEKAFARIVQEILHLKLPLKHVFPVYERNDGDNKLVILYADVTKAREFKPAKEHSFSWFTRKQVTKLPISSQTLQDIIVGQRVVDAKLRKSLGQHTFE